MLDFLLYRCETQRFTENQQDDIWETAFCSARVVVSAKLQKNKIRINEFQDNNNFGLRRFERLISSQSCLKVETARSRRCPTLSVKLVKHILYFIKLGLLSQKFSQRTVFEIIESFRFKLRFLISASSQGFDRPVATRFGENIVGLLWAALETAPLIGL